MNRVACWSGSHCACTNRLENAGCASSAACGHSVMSQADSTSSVRLYWPWLTTTTLRNSMSSSGLTHAVLSTRRVGQLASNTTRST